MKNVPSVPAVEAEPSLEAEKLWVVESCVAESGLEEHHDRKGQMPSQITLPESGRLKSS